MAGTHSGRSTGRAATAVSQVSQFCSNPPTVSLCQKSLRGDRSKQSQAVESVPTSKRPARRRPDDNIFKFGASFGRKRCRSKKRCAASAHRP
eukprot:644523-Prymnesium_polylepis.1